MIIIQKKKLRKITHMRRKWEYLFRIYWYWKTTIKKTVELVFNEIKKNIWRYHYLPMCTKNIDDMINSSCLTECGRLNFIVMGQFLPFHSPKNLKNQNFENNEKNCWRYHHFTNVSLKPQSYDVMVPEIQSETDRFFCYFGSFFALLLL